MRKTLGPLTAAVVAALVVFAGFSYHAAEDAAPPIPQLEGELICLDDSGDMPITDVRLFNRRRSRYTAPPAATSNRTALVSLASNKRAVPYIEQPKTGVVGYNGGNLPEIPLEDSGKYYTSVFLSAHWRANPQEANLVNWINTEPRLKHLAQNTKFRWYTPSDPTFVERFAASVAGRFPMIRVDDNRGQNVLQFGPGDIRSAQQVGDDVVIMCENFQPRQLEQPAVHANSASLVSYAPYAESFRPCPTPQPEPAPTPPPVQPPFPNNTPTETPAPDDGNTPLIIAMLAAAAVAGGARAFYEWRNRTMA